MMTRYKVTVRWDNVRVYETLLVEVDSEDAINTAMIIDGKELNRALEWESAEFQILNAEEVPDE
jgi:hypothetical protein